MAYCHVYSYLSESKVKELNSFFHIFWSKFIYVMKHKTGLTAVGEARFM